MIRQDRNYPELMSIFRIIFGITMVLEMVFLLNNDFINQLLTGPKCHFPYEYLTFIKTLSEPIMNGLLVAILIASICIVLGVFYRFAISFVFLGWSYIFLLEKTIYNNHFYLFMLLALLLIFIPADEQFTWRQLFTAQKAKSNKNTKVKKWHYDIIRFQLCVVYLFGAIAKLNPDWWAGQPSEAILAALPVDNWVKVSFSGTSGVKILSIGGFLFDLCIPLFLISRKSWMKIIGACGVLLFNYVNASIFNDIGIFPIFMIFATIIFLPAKWFNTNETAFEVSSSLTPTRSGYSSFMIIAYVCFQLLFPLRHHLLTDRVDWTAVAQRFSWRMKIQHRHIVDQKFSIIANNTRMPVEIATFLNTSQKLKMAEDPRMIAQFCQCLQAAAIQQGVQNPVVEHNVVVKFNGHEAQKVIAPNVDLTKIDIENYSDNSWIEVLQE